MADLYLQQAEADEMLYFLAMDYRQEFISHQLSDNVNYVDRRILGAVDQALARRRRALKDMQKQLKKSGSEKVAGRYLYIIIVMFSGRDRHG